MKAYHYNNLVKEYKRRIAINNTLEETLKDETFVGYYRQQAEKKFNTNMTVAKDLLEEIKSVKKEDIIFV